MDKFNKAIIKGVGADDYDPDVQNWAATTFGKVFAGHEVEAELPDHCPMCGARRSGTIKKRRLNTSYVDDAQNWRISCLECFEETVDMYAEMWADYYSMTR